MPQIIHITVAGCDNSDSLKEDIKALAELFYNAVKTPEGAVVITRPGVTVNVIDIPADAVFLFESNPKIYKEEPSEYLKPLKEETEEEFFKLKPGEFTGPAHVVHNSGSGAVNKE